MSDVIYVENEINGLNVAINELETEINPEGYIFVRNGENEIAYYVQNVIKPDLDTYSQNKQNAIENTVDVQLDSAKVQLNNFAKTECESYISQTCQEKKEEIIQTADQAEDDYSSFVDGKNQEVETLVSQANQAASSATSSKNAAASSATSSSNYANNSKIWAEGTDSQVQALGGTHSAKGWTNLVNDSVLVHKTGNETITGVKTFNGTSPIKIDRNGNAYVEVMSANNGVRTGGFRNNSDNHNSTIMYVTTDDGSTIKGNIAVVFDGTNTYATCPTPPSTSDNSTKIPTTNWVRSFLATVYPVGSLFFSTASTCPLQSLGIGTWNKVGTSLTLSVNTSVPVKGNGITLGLTDGSANYGLANSDTLYNRFSPYADAYGTSIGNTDVGSHTYKKISFGITTDASKSGVVGTVTRTQITVNIFQRTA